MSYKFQKLDLLHPDLGTKNLDKMKGALDFSSHGIPPLAISLCDRVILQIHGLVSNQRSGI
jgi:hypothetical protein